MSGPKSSHSSHSESYCAIVFLIVAAHGRRDEKEVRVDQFPKDPSEVQMPEGAYAFRYAEIAAGAHVKGDGNSIPMRGSVWRSKITYSGVCIYTIAQLRTAFPGEKDLIQLAERASTGKLVKLPGGGWEPLVPDAVVVNESSHTTTGSAARPAAPFAGGRTISY